MRRVFRSSCAVPAPSLTAQSRPHAPGIVLNTHRMDRFEIFEDDGYFECGPGVRAAVVARALERIGCFLPVWPGSLVIASMGGLVCNNTSGHIVDGCFGKPSDFIMGLQVVLPTGEVLETGTKGMRRIAGTDLTKFFVGSDGLTGVGNPYPDASGAEFPPGQRDRGVRRSVGTWPGACRRSIAEGSPCPCSWR